MSNAVNKIKKNVTANKRLESYTLYMSLMGSIIVTVGKLVGKTEDEMIEDFARFSRDKELLKSKNILEAVNYIINDYKMPEEYKKYIVLCYDEEGIYTPIVSIMREGGYLLPLDMDGNYTGILAQFGKKENIKIEEIFGEE